MAGNLACDSSLDCDHDQNSALPPSNKNIFLNVQDVTATNVT